MGIEQCGSSRAFVRTAKWIRQRGGLLKQSLKRPFQVVGGHDGQMALVSSSLPQLLTHIKSHAMTERADTDGWCYHGWVPKYTPPPLSKGGACCDQHLLWEMLEPDYTTARTNVEGHQSEMMKRLQEHLLVQQDTPR